MRVAVCEQPSGGKVVTCIWCGEDFVENARVQAVIMRATHVEGVCYVCALEWVQSPMAMLHLQFEEVKEHE